MKTNNTGFPFPNFMRDNKQYEECREYWREIVREVAASAGLTDWEPWIHRTGGDDVTPLPKEFLPICDGKSSTLNRAFQIDQYEPESNSYKISAWIKTYDKQFSELPASELRIVLELSQETVGVAKKLLKKWMTTETTISEMDSFIRALLPNQGKEDLQLAN